MIEKVKAVNNPLTIIAIFAALAEIAGTVALKLVADNLQATFIWFVILFPVLLVLLFFITLNFNPKVLYAPSDFKNEENFLTAMGVGKLSGDLQGVQNELEAAKTKIIEDAMKEVGLAGDKERIRLTAIVNGTIGPVLEKVESTQESAEEVALQASPGMKHTELHRHLLKNGCELLREGAKHSVWVNRAARAISTVPRKPEISVFVVRKICLDLHIPEPKETEPR